MKKSEGEYHCVQCGRVLEAYTDVQDKQVPVCTYPDCPNYGLLQLGIEIMKDVNIKTNK